MSTPSGRPPGNKGSSTDSADSPLVICDGPEDTTVRPRRPNMPPFWPADMPLPKPPDPENKPADGQS